ncbi:hypothetical protein [Sporosarcina sp. G11-34]|uniref:UPF0738 family protein n=1 Tax=Sporosarcina sp. G11-34 TaxID=2849605 RepID=UPI0022A98D3E|nr:hypothetical protein [Sporosarcina sp. G11-34]MCZ2257216.1 hypothetical protein [Sporosarcina sp. G11-34]
MTTKLQIDGGIQNDLEICFTVIGTPKTFRFTPAGKMITDSKEMTFVYLLDEEEEYGYIHFPQSVWPLMVDVLKGNKDPVIFYNDVRVPLIGFVEELTMLIFNIEGNDNYGEEFTTVVEKAFKEILTSSE